MSCCEGHERKVKLVSNREKLRVKGQSVDELVIDFLSKV